MAFDPEMIAELRETLADLIAADVREALADEPAETRERAVRKVLSDPAVAAKIEAGVRLFAPRLH